MCSKLSSSSRYSAAKINMFSFSLEMQMVSKCLIVYLVNESQPTLATPCYSALSVRMVLPHTPLPKLTRPHQMQWRVKKSQPPAC